MKDIFTNPLIVKEMRERFRTRKTVWILALYLLVMGSLLLGFMYVLQLNELPMPGDNRELFVMTAVLQYALLCFIAPALAAGTISGERERQTLHVLMTTQLTPAQIVWSKLLTSLAFVFLLVVASLPLYSFVFLYGGISPKQLLLLMVFFAVNILFFGALGVFCSTWIKRTGVSTITAYGLAFFFVVGTGLLYVFLGLLLEELYPQQWLNDSVWGLTGLQILGELNPVLVMFELLGENLGPTFDEYFMTPWIFFTCCYVLLSVLLIWWSAFLLKPVRPGLRWK
ncbi:ABC transporter permease [Brevibacillus fulvus]|uniref:ABC-type transport system involved in multi-copper enzyme maturation permease subunit n=1 Tax=Brevibacillus fulvus TaxID=1125967 RepID=A0A938XUR1_9BACL|nr:ABC transporter permease subunit [Brevibacillus fulvus]MBM7590467.1 ABC-type transport system involved in multi-copper enzyme maturation permease subunit [Brevibacillus fulvus]